MTGSHLPIAELTAEFSTADPPKLLSYHVVVDGQAMALVTLEELALAGFSPVHEVQTLEVADQSKAGSICSGIQRRKAAPRPGEYGTPFGVTTKNLAPKGEPRGGPGPQPRRRFVDPTQWSSASGLQFMIVFFRAMTHVEHASAQHVF